MMRIARTEPKMIELDGELRECTQGTYTLSRDLLERVGDKWTVPVLEALETGPVRFTVIQDVVGEVSHRMLTRTLRALQRAGFVTRTVHPEVPPRVEYAMTDLGRGFVRSLTGFMGWVADNEARLGAARAAYDESIEVLR